MAHGDEVVVDAGEVLLVEDTIGYWFALVIDGTLSVTREGRRLGSIRPGGHVGEVAILGFGPQPATVTTATSSRLFVVGRRELISMADGRRHTARLLFPDVPPEEFRAFLRRLRVEGTTAWQRLPQPVRDRAARPPEGVRAARPGQVVRASSGFTRLAAAAFRPPNPRPDPPPRAAPLVPRRVWGGAAAALVGALVAFVALYHPPFVVVTSTDPIDVTADVTVPASFDRGPVHGRFLLTPVDLRQPTLAQSVLARARGDQVLPLARAEGDDDPVTVGRATFARSQQHAVHAVESLLRLEGGLEGVRVAPRSLQGPSAGLVYALAIADKVLSDDLAAGRTVAATGTVDVEGKVGSVGFSSEKIEAARRAGADLLFVPADRAWPARVGEMRIVPVRTLAEAVGVLRGPHR